MNVSDEELTLRDGLVVCPQCLASYQAVPPTQHPSTATSADAQPAVTTASPVAQYCPHCGQNIGKTINYCPYCGASLHDTGDAHRHDQRERHRHGKPQAESLSQPSRQPKPAVPASEGVEWRPLLPSYSISREHNEPASPRFMAFAVATILALLALLAFIIYHASLIS